MFSFPNSLQLVVFSTLSVVVSSPTHPTLPVSQLKPFFSNPWGVKAQWTRIIAWHFGEALQRSLNQYRHILFFQSRCFLLKRTGTHIHLFCTFYCFALRVWNNLSSFEFHLITLQPQCIIVPSPLNKHTSAFSITGHTPACLGRFFQVLNLLQFNEHVPEKRMKSSCLLVSFASFFKNIWFLFRYSCITFYSR